MIDRLFQAAVHKMVSVTLPNNYTLMAWTNKYLVKIFGVCVLWNGAKFELAKVVSE